MTREELKQMITAGVYQNNQHEITGQGLQEILLAMVDTLHPDSDPGPVSRSTPLTFEAIQDNTPILAKSENGEKTLFYSLDGGTTWQSAVIGEGYTTIATLNAGDTIQLKGDNLVPGFKLAVGEVDLEQEMTKPAPFYAYGNMMSLLAAEGFDVLDEVPARAFAYFFSGTLLHSKAGSPLLLPATTLADSCYYYMFSGCTSLTQAPELPATTLAQFCYQSMFSGCTSLTEAPALPATTLAQYCYSNMFQSCTGLTQAPELPATTLARSCYSNMFSGCTSLTEAPELPVTTLADGCYSNMFEGCSSLVEAPALPATTLAQGCYSNMFQSCTGLTQAPELPATTLAQGCYSNMFKGCTGLTEAPALPATILAKSCYSGMFQGCSNLSSVKCLATDISASGSRTTWLSGVAASGTFTKAAGVTWPSGNSGIPSGWTVVEV